MANQQRIAVVSNTGPLISAFQCGQTDVVKRYINHVYIPESALDEFKKHGFGDRIRAEQKAGWITSVPLESNEVTEASRLAERIAASPLTNDKVPQNHLPEAEAMVLMRRPQLEVKRLLIEELAARQIAKEEGIDITGFIGILLLACGEKDLTPDEMRQSLETCRQQGTHYSQTLIDDVCRMCAELSQ